jgi:glyoxylase-like metal-dependent hydrolase (beta-lactamase superfamily II)
MKQLHPDIFSIEGLNGCNAYLLVSDGNLTLVDTGLAKGVDQIEQQMREGNFQISDLKTIVLTHAHGDHTGNASELVKRSQARVFAHRDDAPYIDGTKAMPAASFISRVLNWLSDHVLFSRSPCKVDRVLEDGDRIDALGGMRVIHSPGHTPGSICLYQEQRRILFCGDVLFNMNPLTQKPGLRFPLPMVTIDLNLARESVRKLAALPVETMFFGHGEPILGGAGGRVAALLAAESAQSDCG